MKIVRFLLLFILFSCFQQKTECSLTWTLARVAAKDIATNLALNTFEELKKTTIQQAVPRLLV